MSIQLQAWGISINYKFFQSQETLNKVQAFGVDKDSMSRELVFRNPESADFTIVCSQDAFQVGFENFPMDIFSVYSEHLKILAEKPEISMLIMNDSSDAKKVFEWLNGKVRSISGFGDRSAYGLPDEAGVVIISIDFKGILNNANIQSGDVIRSINHVPIKNIDDLFTTTDKAKWKNKLKIRLFRNQKLIEKSILLRR